MLVMYGSMRGESVTECHHGVLRLTRRHGVRSGHRVLDSGNSLGRCPMRPGVPMPAILALPRSVLVESGEPFLLRVGGRSRLRAPCAGWREVLGTLSPCDLEPPCPHTITARLRTVRIKFSEIVAAGFASHSANCPIPYRQLQIGGAHPEDHASLHS